MDTPSRRRRKRNSQLNIWCRCQFQTVPARARERKMARGWHNTLRSRRSDRERSRGHSSSNTGTFERETCSDMQSRIEHLVTSQENPTLIFRLSMLLKFYRHTLTRMLRESAQLVVVMTKYGSPAQVSTNVIVSRNTR